MHICTIGAIAHHRPTPYAAYHGPVNQRRHCGANTRVRFPINTLHMRPHKVARSHIKQSTAQVTTAGWWDSGGLENSNNRK